MRNRHTPFRRYEKLLLKLNKLPIIRTHTIVKRIVCRIYNIPITTSFDKDFYCAAPLADIGDNVSFCNTRIYNAYAHVVVGKYSGFSFGNTLITSTHDIPSGVFAAGNPCKPIRKINFQIEKQNGK
jgi:acetyltransferase-like isoleucine patch superfamily enzyme